MKVKVKSVVVTVISGDRGRCSYSLRRRKNRAASSGGSPYLTGVAGPEASGDRIPALAHVTVGDGYESRKVTLRHQSMMARQPRAEPFRIEWEVWYPVAQTALDRPFMSSW